MSAHYPGQRLLTRGLLTYAVSDADLVRQFARLTKGARVLPDVSAPPATTETVRPGR